MTDSRPAPGGVLRRRRQCKVKCSTSPRFTTYEITAGKYSDTVPDFGALKPVLLRITNDLQTVSERLYRAEIVAETVEAAKTERG